MPEILMKVTKNILKKLKEYDLEEIGKALISNVEKAFSIENEKDVAFDVEKTVYTTAEAVKIKISFTVGEDEYNRGKPFNPTGDEIDELEAMVKETLKKLFIGVTDNIFVWIIPIRNSNFLNVYPYPEGYRDDVNAAPEEIKLSVLWQKGNLKPEFGTAIKMGKTWYIQSDPNPYANGHECAIPTAWHPE